MCLTICSGTVASAQGWSDTAPLDTLLPTPFWLRSRADELNVDAEMKQRIEKTYQASEPKYHELKKIVEQRTKQLNNTLSADELDEKAILKRMQTLLDAENELKLYQVKVRISLLSQLSTEQWRMAQDLVKRKPDADWRGVMAAKVERVRQLVVRLKDSGNAVTEVEDRMKSIEATIADGKITSGARMLTQLISDIENTLNETRKQQTSE